MSGSVVLAEDRFVIGVIHSVNLASDGRSLTVTPITAIEDLPDRRRKQFWTALGVRSIDELLRLPADAQRLVQQLPDYEYDIYVSYWPKSVIEPWISNRFMKTFRGVLLEELGRQPSIFVAADAENDNQALKRSRVLLAVISKQYFFQDRCRVAFESMLQREADEGFSTVGKPIRLVHAIVAHDLLSDEAVPAEYRGRFDPINFKEWAYDFEMQDWQIHKSFNDAIGILASGIAAAVMQAPTWRSDFPLQSPSRVNRPIQRRPTFLWFLLARWLLSTLTKAARAVVFWSPV
jgi:hypothetical protein